MSTITAPSGYSYRKHPTKVTLRPLTLDEAKALTCGSHVWFLANDGKARQIKVNGRPKVWKTRPLDVSIPVKYGLYEHGYFECRGGSWRDQYPCALVSEED